MRVTGDSLPATLQLLKAEADDFELHAQAVTTRSVYAWAWEDFRRWHISNDLPFDLPIDPEIIALWITHGVKTGLKTTSIHAMLASVSWHHRDKGYADPTKSPRVKAVWSGIKRTKHVRPKGKVALTVDLVKEMVDKIPKDTHYFRFMRDRTILLLGISTGMRRRELAMLQCSDCVFHKKGVRLLIRRGKTDQEGRGRIVTVPYQDDPKYCPVESLHKWLLVKRKTARVFPFHPRTISNIVKDRAAAIGINPTVIGTHSLRAGFVTSALIEGRSIRSIKRITGHKSTEALEVYAREIKNSDANENLL